LPETLVVAAFEEAATAPDEAATTDEAAAFEEAATAPDEAATTDEAAAFEEAAATEEAAAGEADDCPIIELTNGRTVPATSV